MALWPTSQDHGTERMVSMGSGVETEQTSMMGGKVVWAGDEILGERIAVRWVVVSKLGMSSE